MAGSEHRLRGSAWRRRVDLWVGAPLLGGLGLLRAKRPRPREIRRVVLLQTAAIGDTLLMAQAIRRVREALPGARLVLALGRDNGAACKLLPPVDEVVSVDPLRPWAALRQLRAQRADVLVDYGTWPRINALLSALSGAAYTIGFQTPGQARHFAYDLAVTHSAARHEVENQRALLGFLGEAKGWDTRLAAPAAGVPVGAGPVRPYVVFHAWASGSGKRLKEWPAVHWVKLAAWAADHGFGVVLTGGGSDKEDTARLAEKMREQAPGIRLWPLAGLHSLAETAGVIQAAAAVVSVNTGLMHLAALTEVPTIGLHGPTNPTRWGPYGEKCVSLLPARGVCAYLNLGFEFPRNVQPCMADLDPARVVVALEQLLGQSPAKPPGEEHARP